MAGMVHKTKRGMTAAAGVRGGAGMNAGMELSVHYKVRAFRQGKLMWVEAFDNLVVNGGLDDSLDKHLKGSAYTAAWCVDLTDGTPTPAAADTMVSHAGWVVVGAYDEATRPVLTLGTVSGQSVNNTGNEATFTISTNNTTVGGCFICSDNVKAATDGVLYGVGAFTAADKTLDDNDVLEVTVTLTAAAA